MEFKDTYNTYDLEYGYEDIEKNVRIYKKKCFWEKYNEGLSWIVAICMLLSIICFIIGYFFHGNLVLMFSSIGLLMVIAIFITYKCYRFIEIEFQVVTLCVASFCWIIMAIGLTIF